ncbi:fluoride efflux transporter CrcB [Lederbergia sp. NSJ-179]|uniref:fluoride efflux transporter CrcB n=1 Tax=Lederbergia sp. NSJ-179 TaxID=2931402 RepID=UPI001FD2364B|nr:fluoride efflux transporter CrcB [Lederbergia sp. NSJ-179]MCJ7842043.1 fluoride efflux transporter CrcB [Lederbergia sp. NSJ-179]
MLPILLVAIGGFFGAIARFWVSSLIKTQYPIATLVVNLTGSFLLGLIIGANLENSLQLLFGTGFMGAFTTFSTFKLENIQLFKEKKWDILVLYLALSYTLGIFLAFIGIKIGASF